MWPLTLAAAMLEVIRTFEAVARLPEKAEAVAAIYQPRLDGKKVLFLWDNGHAEGQMRPLLDAMPGSCGLLVTSRKAMALPHKEEKLSINLWLRVTYPCGFPTLIRLISGKNF